MAISPFRNAVHQLQMEMHSGLLTPSEALLRTRQIEADYEKWLADEKRSAAKKPTHKGEVMEVGKIITKEAYRSSYSRQEEQSISVDMSKSSITLRGNGGDDGGGGSRQTPLTPEQALELGQFLLKAAELQPEYSAAHQRLADEGEKLDKRFKDMISGLGIDPDVEVDVLDDRGTFTVVDAGNVIEA